MQIDGYSLDAQKTKMKAFCDYNEYEIAGEYEDAGKSGKSIEGRVSFNQTMEGRMQKAREVNGTVVLHHMDILSLMGAGAGQGGGTG